MPDDKNPTPAVMTSPAPSSAKPALRGLGLFFAVLVVARLLLLAAPPLLSFFLIAPLIVLGAALFARLHNKAPLFLRATLAPVLEHPWLAGAIGSACLVAGLIGIYASQARKTNCEQAVAKFIQDAKQQGTRTVSPDEAVRAWSDDKATAVEVRKLCEKAGMMKEARAMAKAEEFIEPRLADARQLAQQQADAEAAERRRTPPPEKRQAAKSVDEEDPNCPAGQMRIDTQSRKFIKCTGPAKGGKGQENIPANMSWREAETFLRSLGLSVRPGRDPNTLRGEDDEKIIVYDFAEANDSKPAKCIAVLASGDELRKPFDWKATVARWTGASPARVRDGGSVEAGQRRLKIKVEQPGVGVFMGDCD